MQANLLMIVYLVGMHSGNDKYIFKSVPIKNSRAPELKKVCPYRVLHQV